MNTYTIRDTRKQKLILALAAVASEPADLRSVLEAEQSALETDNWTVTDDTFKAVAVDWIWQNFMVIKQLADKDPALLALGAPSLLTDAQALAISNINLPHTPMAPDNYLDQVLIAVDNEEAILSELLQSAHQAWFAAGMQKTAYPFDDVGVLLPLRLETLFDTPGSKFNDNPLSWKLSIRVLPDEASICRDNTFLSTDEVKSLQTFWQSIQQPGDVKASWLNGDEAKIAWTILSTKMRPERAAFLVATVNIQIQDAIIQIILPADMPEKAVPNRVGGMPPELKIFAVSNEVINGTDHHFIGRLPMDKDKFIDTASLTLPLPSEVVKEKECWWANWEKAKTVGLGGEFIFPVGITPQNIQAIYVVGIGEETPDAHFTTQIDGGELSIARLGDATNTIKGAATGDPVDWQKIAQNRLANRLTPSSVSMNTGDKMAQCLTGRSGSLPFFAGADAVDDTLRGNDLVKALWPSLWGHWLHDIWNLGDDAYRRGLWAFENVFPEGPLMPVRIDDQPYGLLPVTALKLWEIPPADNPDQAQQDRAEIAMANALARVVDIWAKTAEKNRCTVGKTTEEFMELLGQDAISTRFIERSFFPFSTLMAGYQLNPDKQNEFAKIAMNTYETAIEIMGSRPIDAYLSSSYWRPMGLPLVQAERSLYKQNLDKVRSPFPLTELLDFLINFDVMADPENYDLETIFNTLIRLQQYQIGALPNSLLIRLLVHACQTGFVWHRTDVDNNLLQALLNQQQKQAMNIAKEIDQDIFRKKEEDTISKKLFFTNFLPENLRKELERSFAATLDTAAHRIDPWVTGFAWQRLKNHSASSRGKHRLGAYGWVNGPFIGQPGPTDAGLLHTPSYNQTLGAIIMRDKFLSAERSNQKNDNGVNPWQMNINSKKVRLAGEIAEEIRMGFHLHEVIGRQVEHIVAKPLKIRELRQDVKYAMHAERKDINEVCNGVETLQGLLKSDINFPMSGEQQDSLQLLQDSLDTYSDLLMADGVVQLMNRQIDKAAETMDAAAGLSRPPSFDFIRTPPSGYQLETVVLSALPFIAVESIADSHPIRIADPSVAAFLENKLGNNWVWTAINMDTDAVIDTVSLTTLQLLPIDMLTLSNDMICDMVRRKLQLPHVYITISSNRNWEAFNAANNSIAVITLAGLNAEAGLLADPQTTAALIITRLALPPDTIVRETVPGDLRIWVARDENGKLLGMADKISLGQIEEDEEKLNRSVRQFLGLPKVKINAPRQHQLAQHLVAALGNRPAAGRDFTDNKALPVINDTGVYSELISRYKVLYAAGNQLVSALRNAPDDNAIILALRQALPWGIVPAGSAADRESLMAALLQLPLPALATSLKTLAETVAITMEKRISDAIAPGDLANENDISKPLSDHEQRKQQNNPDGVPTLAKAIAGLASPNARLAILACWSKEDIISNTKLEIGNVAAIDEDWLSVTAAVRGDLARLEALQLEMETPLVSWTNILNDPWRTGNQNIIKQNLFVRDTDSVAKMTMPYFVAAYGTADTWGQNKVAVGLIDSFGEAIPMPHRKTMAAFGFNAPAARAPQAILLAVPPKLRQRLDTDLLFKIIEETRSLAHARMARLEDVGDLQSIAPSMWFQSSGPARVRLEPWTLFDR